MSAYTHIRQLPFMAGHCRPLHGDEWRLHDAHPLFTSRWPLRV